MNNLVPQVYYPRGGEHFVLLWWTNNEQNQLVVAKSKSGICTAAINIIEKYSDAIFVDFKKINIVIPTVKSCQKIIDKKYENSVNYFFEMITCNIRTNNCDYLPGLFEKCKKYKNKYNEKVIADDWHSSCKNCTNGTILTSMTKKEFYEKYSNAYYEAYPHQKEYVDKLLQPSRADHVKNNKELWVARSVHGVNLDKLGNDLLFCMNPLFYFIDIEKLDKELEKLNKLQEDFFLKQDEKRKIYNEKRLASEKIKKDLEKEKFLKLWK